MLTRSFTTLMALVLILVVFTGCALPSSPSIGRSSPPPTFTLLPSPSPSPTPPIPGPVPTNCPVSTLHPQSALTGLGPVIGATPVWVTWGLTGPAIVHLEVPPPYPSTYFAPYGWQTAKLIWEVGPRYMKLATIHGHERLDHTPLLFQFLTTTPTANAVLDPQHPDHPASAVGVDWAEWGSYLVVPKAGCYTMEVSWPTGQWSITFAAGA